MQSRGAGGGRHRGCRPVTLTTILTLVDLVLFGVLFPALIGIWKIAKGVKCELRTEMLRIYYHNRTRKTIRQYEYENFVYLYDAYKALKGNSFIDKIYKEVKTWEVLT